LWQITKKYAYGILRQRTKEKNGLFGDKYEPDTWLKDIPYNYTHDSQIWDWDASDNDGDGYRDGSVGDSDLWDDKKIVLCIASIVAKIMAIEFSVGIVGKE